MFSTLLNGAREIKDNIDFAKDAYIDGQLDEVMDYLEQAKLDCEVLKQQIQIVINDIKHKKKIK